MRGASQTFLLLRCAALAHGVGEGLEAGDFGQSSFVADWARRVVREVFLVA